MSDRFDDLLSGVVDSASSAAHEFGADAARKRGRQRRNRQRLAASTLSLALLGLVGGVAAVAHGSHGVPAAGVTASPNRTTASASPSPTVTLSVPPPVTSGSSSPSSTTASPNASSSTSSASVSIVVSPSTYRADAWLPVTQMPFYQAGTTDWAYNSYNTGTHLGGHVYELGSNGFVIGCSDDMAGGNLTSLGTNLAGVQYQAFTGPNSDKILSNGAIPAYTDQAAYFYGSTAEAEAAMSGLATDFAQCKSNLTGTDASTGTSFVGDTQQTLATQDAALDAQCWTVVAKSAKSTGGETIHDCFVRSGNVVGEVHVEINEVATFNDENFPALDATLVPALQTDLGVYPTG